MKMLLATLMALPGPFQIAPRELPWAALDRPYTQSLAVRGGVRCAENDLRVWTEGALPEGLELDVNGQFRGVPVRPGTYPFLVRAENTCGQSAWPYTLVVTGAPVLIVTGNQLEFHYRRGGPAPRPQSIQVRGTWPGLEYTIEKAGVPWLRTLAHAGRTPRPGAPLDCDLVEVMVDPSDLATGDYPATLRLGTWHGANEPEVKVRLKVD